MTEFVAFDPGVESKGAAILATLQGLPFDIEPILSAHGLHPLDPDGWYPQQSWLNVLRDITWLPGVSSLELVSIGMKIPKTADWPPEVKTLEEALSSIGVAYGMNHRGGETGYYQAEQIDDSTIQVICQNPFPSDFDYGIVYEVARQFRPEGTEFYVDRAASPSRLKGDERCIYYVCLG